MSFESTLRHGVLYKWENFIRSEKISISQENYFNQKNLNCPQKYPNLRKKISTKKVKNIQTSG